MPAGLHEEDLNGREATCVEARTIWQQVRGRAPVPKIPHTKSAIGAVGTIVQGLQPAAL